jgi:polysaccharide pyruvyl transferase CsaB
MTRNAEIEALRAELATTIIDQDRHWRILFLGRATYGPTDVVPSICRSLRNLGHHVLDLDTARHADLVDNPDRVKAGFGPIYLRSELLAPIIERFSPQVIVCCAGGLTLREDHAEELKRRGILLIGLTLSDPDVFPSIQPHAHVFDVHTTNAAESLERYRQAGVRNTLYFPFGIDRGYVTQAVPEAPELEADVICVGHARGRPERNRVMNRLAGQFDVKTYGNGWDIPGSEPVQDRRLIQASRAGKVHVNFPLTRAGYINIKCGVFESVGSGALLATRRFDEMGRFFAYDEEIIGYRDEDDLVRQIERLLADPARHADMTLRAFRRLVSEHLYEHRWLALFAEIQSLADSKPSWWPHPGRAGEVRQILSESKPRAKHVVVSGFYGARNAGDELILRSLTRSIEHRDPAAQVWVAAESPAEVERTHARQAFSRRSLTESLDVARTASAVVLGGGGLWHDYTFERAGGLAGLFSTPQLSIAGMGVLPLMASMVDAEFHVAGMGVGPLSDPDAMRMVRFVARDARSIMVRDRGSFELLVAAGVPANRVELAPDLVYGLELEPGPAPPELEALRVSGRALVGVNLRSWSQDKPEALAGTVAEALLTVAQQRPLAVIAVPMQDARRGDAAILVELARRLEGRIPVLVPPASRDPGMPVALLARIDAMIAMRLHAALLAHRLRRPAIGIAYDPKVRHHFADLGRDRQCLDLPVDGARLARLLEAVLDEGSQLPEDAARLVRDREARAGEALHRLASRLAAAPARKVVFEVPRLNVADPGAVDRRDRLAAAAPTLEAHLAGIALAAAGGIELTDDAPEREGKQVEVWLPTEQPRAGDAMEATGEIVIAEAGTGSVEIALQLMSKYVNPRAEGRIYYRLAIGEGQAIEEDLAVSAEPIRVTVFANGARPVPFRLTVKVRRSCFASSVWPRSSRVVLSVDDARRSVHGFSVAMTANRGRFEAL